MPKQKWKGKQYCAEPEVDPYDQIYRKSDIFLDYMHESSCKIPRIEESSCDPSELLETIDSIDLPAHRLTGKVRCQYLKYLQGLLDSNYSAWSGTVEPYENVTFSPDEIKRCAESIEMKAVQSCMIASLYRKYILNTISKIRKETKECSLHPNLVNIKFTPKIIKKECNHVSVQTDEIHGSPQERSNLIERVGELPDVPAMSLDEKIRNFEAKMQVTNRKSKSSNKRSKSKKQSKSSSEVKPKLAKTSDDLPAFMNSTECTSKPIENIATTCESFSKQEDDHIIRELEAMFDNGDEENIFDSCENQVQINAIINEIEKFDPQQVEIHSKTLHLPSPELNELTDVNAHITEHSSNKEADLKKSLWPCEFHMQKMKLRELLSNIADTNYFKYERIRLRFIELFGEYEEEEDELGPYSPSIELNEVLISSCRQRIAKWVVQLLMKPLNDGLIGNRFLFKKLAKHLADGIIYTNQYPNQKFIKNYIVDYFCTHPAILSVEDMY